MRCVFSLTSGALAACLVLLPWQSGCESRQAVAAAPPPSVVTVSQPISEKVADYLEFTGNTAPVESVDIRARVKGFLKKVNFTDGANVKENELLYEIEPDIFQAQVDSATAQLEAAKAQLEKATADLAIKKEMAAGNAASKLDVIQAQAAVDVAKASVQLTTAQLEQAKIDLGYTKVYAPLSGRIDKTRVDAGNLVGADGNTLLANIVQMDPIYVYFEVDEANMQRFQQRMLEKGMKLGTQTPKLPFTLALGDTDDFAFSGTLDYVNNQVDQLTGTIQVRGILHNEKRLLAPGFFARIRLPNGDPYQAVLVPQRAIGVDQGQKYVLVVNEKNEVELRPIEVGSQHGRMVAVTKGLKPDEWVITEGLLRTRPGATVAPEKKPVTAVEAESAEPTTSPTTQPQS